MCKSKGKTILAQKKKKKSKPHFSPQTKGKKTGVLKGYYRVRAQIIYWALSLVREHEQSKEEQIVMNDSGLGFSEQDMNGKLVRGGITPRIR